MKNNDSYEIRWKFSTDRRNKRPLQKGRIALKSSCLKAAQKSAGDDSTILQPFQKLTVDNVPQFGLMFSWRRGWIPVRKLNFWPWHMRLVMGLLTIRMHLGSITIFAEKIHIYETSEAQIHTLTDDVQIEKNCIEWVMLLDEASSYNLHCYSLLLNLRICSV